MSQQFDFDPVTKIGRTNVWSVGNVRNADIARADLIIGRGGRILKDRRGGRTDRRCSDEIIREYEEAAR